MPHRQYQTETFVLKALDTGECSRFFYLLTKDLGLILARAQGVRKLAAKNQAHLTIGGWCRTTLVRGRETWHLVGAESGRQPGLGSLLARRLLIRVRFLILRLMPRDWPQAEVYRLLARLHHTLLSPEVNPETNYYRRLELTSVAKLLHSLGYLPKLDPTQNENVLCDAINQALASSHL